MKLSYRGISYETTPSTLEIKEGEVGGKYRGQDWKYHYPRHIPQAQPKLNREYEGVAYSLRDLPHSESPPGELIKTSCPVSLKKPGAVTVNSIDKVHLENIRQRFERRLQIAQERGDDNLVNLLEQESKELALF